MTIGRSTSGFGFAECANNPDADGWQTSRSCEKDNTGRDALPLKFAICDPQFKLDNSKGGIAQLVERQLCKLEVRGSNPLASSLRSRRRGE
jgi:hypothetical protein